MLKLQKAILKGNKYCIIDEPSVYVPVYKIYTESSKHFLLIMEYFKAHVASYLLSDILASFLKRV